VVKAQRQLAKELRLDARPGFDRVHRLLPCSYLSIFAPRRGQLVTVFSEFSAMLREP
jgi:hypothetical protein